MAMMDGITGIVMGSVFGGIFVLTCLLSTIKAVRDRKRIKKKIAEREKLRIDSGTSGSGSDIEEKQTTPVQGQSTVNGITNNCVPVPYIDGDSPVRTTVPQAQVYCVSDGVDNLTFKHSHADIKSSTNSNSTNDTPRVKQNYHLKSNAKSVENVRSNSNSTHVPKRTLTSTETNGDERGNGLRLLPPDCLAVRKTARRYSYEIAVGEHSWLPVEMPNFASSETIMNTYTYGGGTAPHAKSTIGFENRAYDDGYYKKPRLLVKKL